MANLDDDVNSIFGAEATPLVANPLDAEVDSIFAVKEATPQAKSEAIFEPQPGNDFSLDDVDGSVLAAFDSAKDFLEPHARVIGSAVVGTAGQTVSGLGKLAGAGKVLAADQDHIDFSSQLSQIVDSAGIIALDRAETALGNVGGAINDFAGGLNIPEEEQTFGTMIESAIAQTGSQVAATLLNPVLGLLTLVGPGAEATAAKVKEEGAEGTVGGAQAIILGTTGTALAEKVGIDRLLKKLPDELSNTIAQQAKDIITSSGIEAAEEYLEGVLQDLAIKLTVNADKDIFHKPGEEEAAAGIAGGAIRGFINAVLPKKFKLPPSDPEKGGTPSMDKDVPAKVLPFQPENAEITELTEPLQPTIVPTPPVDMQKTKGAILGQITDAEGMLGIMQDEGLDVEGISAQKSFIEELKASIEPATPLNTSNANIDQAREQQIKLDSDDHTEIYGNLDERPPLSEWVKRAEVPLGGAMVDQLDGKRDSFSRFKDVTITLLQLAKKNPHIPGLLQPTLKGEPGFVQLNREIASDKVANDLETDAKVKQWRDLGSNEAHKVGNLLVEMDRLSFTEGKRLSETDARRLAKDLKMSPKAWESYKGVRDHFLMTLEKMESSLIARSERLGDNTTPEGVNALASDKSSILASMNKLRTRNYFPSTRFGNEVVKVVANQDTTFEGKRYLAGETLIREHFESAKEAESRKKELSKIPNATASISVLSDVKIQSFQGMPAPVLEAIRDTVGPDQQQAIDEAILQTAPGRGFPKHMLKKRGVAGASRDYMRGYVSYMQSFSRYQARVNHGDRMDSAIQSVKDSAIQIDEFGGNSRDRIKIADWMTRQKNYVWDPGNELNEWSALAFNWYLAAVPKQAILNVMQIPAVALPYLSSKYGDVKAIAAIGKAQKHVFDKAWNPGKLSLELQEALMQGEHDGPLAQTFAHEAAAVQQARNLDRLLPKKFFGVGNTKYGQKLAELTSMASSMSSWIFHKSEIFTRRTIFVAAWELEFAKSGGDKYKAYQAARDGVQAGAFEYARYNRPRFMRGKAKPLTIFMTHPQHMIEYLAGKNPGSYRAFALLLLMAGLEGLPFVGNIEDIVSYFLRKANEMSGKHPDEGNAHKMLQDAIKQQLEMANANSPAFMTDLILHGAGRYGFGLPWMGEQAGLPISAWDITPSITLGRPLPFTEALNSPPDQRLGRATEGLAGAGLGIPLQIMKSLGDTAGDPWKRAIAAMPRAIGNPLKAIDVYNKGAWTNKAGIPIAEFDKTNPLHISELIWQAAGLPPTRINLAREERWLQKTTLAYYQTQRSLLTMQYAKAIEAGSVEAEKDVNKAISKYNDSVPHPSLKWFKVDSVITALKRRELEKKGIPTRMMDIPMSREVQQLFKDIEDPNVTLDPLPKTR